MVNESFVRKWPWRSRSASERPAASGGLSMASVWCRIFISFPLPAFLHAAEISALAPPSKGEVHSDTRPSSILYECEHLNSGKMRCRFTELDIWTTRVSRATLGSPMRPLREEECAQAARQVAEAAASAGLQSGGDDKESDALARARAIDADCASGGSAGRAQYQDTVAARIERQCRLVASSYMQTFRRVASDGAAQERWITEGEPEGPCGYVRQSRFEQRTLPDGSKTWRYVAQLKVQKLSAQSGPLQCSDLKEVEAVYEWGSRQEPIQLECEGIWLGAGCYLTDFPCLSDGPVLVH